jgi:hypothetical protein
VKTLFYGAALSRKGIVMQSGDPKIADHEAEPSAIVRNLGLIKAAAIIMGVLIIVLTVAVIGTIASRLAKMSAPPAEMSISLPQGVTLRSASADGDGFVIVVETPEGTQIWRLSPDGEPVQTIGVVSE